MILGGNRGHRGGIHPLVRIDKSRQQLTLLDTRSGRSPLQAAMRQARLQRGARPLNGAIRRGNGGLQERPVSFAGEPSTSRTTSAAVAASAAASAARQ